MRGSTHRGRSAHAGSRVGTVVPCLDATYLREALQSLTRQTLQHRILVVDDGSPDARATQIATELGIEVIRNDRPTGAAAARNLGIGRLRSPWIMNFDADNIAHPRMLEHLLRAAMSGRNVGIAYCRAWQIGSATGPHPSTHRALPWQLKYGNFIDASSLFSFSAWEDSGGVDATMAPLEDWDFWLSIVERGWRVVYVPKFLFGYRIHPASVLRTTSPGAMDEAFVRIRAKHAAFVDAHHRDDPLQFVARTVARVRRMIDDASPFNEASFWRSLRS